MVGCFKGLPGLPHRRPPVEACPPWSCLEPWHNHGYGHPMGIRHGFAQCPSHHHVHSWYIYIYIWLINYIIYILYYILYIILYIYIYICTCTYIIYSGCATRLAKSKQPLSHSGRVAAPATLAERLSGCVAAPSHSGRMSQWVNS